jgi:competence protein ComEC
MHISFYRRPLFILLVIYALYLALSLKIPEPPHDLVFAKDALVEALVTGYPVLKGGEMAFESSLLTINGQKTGFKVYARCRQNCPVILRGQKLTLLGAVEAVQNKINFGSFDWAKYLARKHIFAQLNIERVENAETASLFWVAVSKARNSILNVFEKNFDKDLLPVLGGITIGEKGDINKTLYEAFQDSGAMHLLVASGGNVGFVTLIIYFLCSLLGAGRKTAASLALFSAGLYTLTAGADAPLLRAYIMTICATAGFLLGRKSGILHGFTAAALFILIINPQALFEAGFQMSFLATLAIILFTSNFKLSFKINRFFKIVLQLFFISLAAQLALMPVFTNYFYKVSLAAVVSNIILVPLSGVIMAGGFLVWLLSLLHAGFVFESAVWTLKYLLVLFRALVEFFADFGLSKITIAAFGWPAVAAYFTALFAFLNYPIMKRKFLYGVCCGFIVLAIMFLAPFVDRNAKHILEGRYGKSLLLKESGKTKLIGAGIEGGIIRKAVLAGGSKKIDCLFLSGTNKSASYALENLENIKIKNIYMPYADIYKETQERLFKFNAAVAMLWPGDEACGVKAAKAWYLDNKNRPYEREGAGSLSYAAGGFYVSGNIKEILTAREFEKFAVIK